MDKIFKMCYFFAHFPYEGITRAHNGAVPLANIYENTIVRCQVILEIMYLDHMFITTLDNNL